MIAGRKGVTAVRRSSRCPHQRDGHARVQRPRVRAYLTHAWVYPARERAWLRRAGRAPVVRLAGRSSAVKFSIVLLSESCGAGAVGKVHCPWCSPGRTMVLRSGTSGGLRAASRAVLGCRVHPATGAMVCVDFCGAAAGLRGGDRLLQGETRSVRSLPVGGNSREA